VQTKIKRGKVEESLWGKKDTRHLEKRRLQDEWCKEQPLEMLPTPNKTPK